MKILTKGVVLAGLGEERLSQITIYLYIFWLPDPTKVSLVILFCLTPDDFTCQGRPSVHEAKGW